MQITIIDNLSPFSYNITIVRWEHNYMYSVEFSCLVAVTSMFAIIVVLYFA